MDVKCSYCGYKLPEDYKAVKVKNTRGTFYYCSRECAEKDAKATVRNNG